MKRFIRTKDNKIHIVETPEYKTIEEITNHIQEKMDYALKIGYLEKIGIVAESDNVVDLIQVGDLVGLDWFYYKTKGITCRQVNSYYAEYNEVKKIYIESNDVVEKNKNVINDITKIYTKQGDNYILVWDKDRGVI